MNAWDAYVNKIAEHARVAATVIFEDALPAHQRNVMLAILSSNANTIVRARRLEALGVECP